MGSKSCSQRLTEPDAERSKIAEFGMTLEGPTARWHAKHLPGSFAMFEALKAKFLRLFHRQVEQRELVGQFYTTHQEEHETVPQFIIRFQTLHIQLTRAPPEDESKAVFLAALREPLRTMCGVLDFRTSTMDQVIDRVLFHVSRRITPDFARGRGSHVSTCPAMHNMPKLGPLNSRLHNENTMHDTPLTCAYNGPMGVQLA